VIRGVVASSLSTPPPGGSAYPRKRREEHPDGRTAGLVATGIDMTFGNGPNAVHALHDVSLSVASGEFVAIIGPSGCGKSTLLDILAGLEKPGAGRVEFEGREITGTVGALAYMPQKDLLMPWRTVLDNTILPLELAHVPKKEARRRALELFPRFGLSGFERQYPAVLSGGMRQRAALLRTVLTDRSVLLLDEPFGALDAITRADMQSWLLDVWSAFRRTIVLVTHDVDEALYLADRVFVMTPRPGTIRAEIDVPIARPRPHDEVVTSATFGALKHRVLLALHGIGGSE
jgi:ABC-type nitrate/sulfonate/bicarbonate transport system ATPase subunit